MGSGLWSWRTKLAGRVEKEPREDSQDRTRIGTSKTGCKIRCPGQTSLR